MSNEVIIKSNRYGIRLILNDQLPFEELTSVVANKFQEISDFFKDAKMAVSFEERTLTLEEEVKLTEIIMEHSNIQVISIIDHDKEMEEQMRRKLQNFELSMQQQFADSQQNNTSNMPQVQEDESHNDFYKGNLRSGQTLESNSSITIIGDVNPGAKVISAGNIVILGSLKGNAHAGAMGDTNCFILALEMNPIQLQIGDFIAKCPDKEIVKRKFKKREKVPTSNLSPQVAIVQDEYICIEPITKTCLNNL